MINTARKGLKLERKAELELQAEGCRTWKKIRVRYLNNDIFGLFDLLALPEDGRKLRMIQVKANYCRPEVREAIRDLKVPSSIQKEVWTWKDRVGWKKEIIE